jgi:hypothetical protein
VAKTSNRNCVRQSTISKIGYFRLNSRADPGLISARAVLFDSTKSCPKSVQHKRRRDERERERDRRFASELELAERREREREMANVLDLTAAFGTPRVGLVVGGHASGKSTLGVSILRAHPRQLATRRAVVFANEAFDPFYSKCTDLRGSVHSLLDDGVLPHIVQEQEEQLQNHASSEVDRLVEVCLSLGCAGRHLAALVRSYVPVFQEPFLVIIDDLYLRSRKISFENTTTTTTPGLEYLLTNSRRLNVSIFITCTSEHDLPAKLRFLVDLVFIPRTRDRALCRSLFELYGRQQPYEEAFDHLFPWLMPGHFFVLDSGLNEGKQQSQLKRLIVTDEKGTLSGPLIPPSFALLKYYYCRQVAPV